MWRPGRSEVERSRLPAPHLVPGENGHHVEASASLARWEIEVPFPARSKSAEPSAAPTPQPARPKRDKPAKQQTIQKARPDPANPRPASEHGPRRRYAWHGVSTPYACVPATGCPGLQPGHLRPSESGTGPDPEADLAPLCHRCLEWAYIFGHHDKERPAASRWPARWSALGERITAARGWERPLSAGVSLTRLAQEEGVC